MKLCKLAEGKSVIIYTDSCYDFGVVHDFGALWQQRDILTFSAPINNHDLVSALWDAILLPLQFAVFKCAAHMNNPDPASQGNAKVDAVALSVVLFEVSHQVKDALSQHPARRLGNHQRTQKEAKDPSPGKDHSRSC